MLKLLDKYILQKFLTTYVFVVLILVSVICVIDFTEKNDDFIKHSLSTKSIIFDYYIHLIPYYANMLSPITVFIATVFVTAQLAAHTEVIAMLSSGMSFRRLMVPYVGGAIIIGAVIFVLIGWVIPNSNKKRVAFEIAYLKNPFSFDERNIHMKIAPETFVYMESYDNTVNIGYKFALESIKGLELTSKLTANRIEWLPKEKKWKLEEWKIHQFNGEKEQITGGAFMDTTLTLLPKDFASNYHRAETFTIPELNWYIRTQRMRGADDLELYETEKYERFSYPFAIIILTVIGVIVSARKARGGVGLQIAIGFLMAFVFIIFVILMRSFAQAGGISPMFAPWVPPAVFTLIGAIMYKTVPR